MLLADQISALSADPACSPTLASRAMMLTRNLRRLVTTIQWVTDVGDLCRGQIRLAPTLLDMVEAVNEVCREIAAEAAQRRAELVVAPGPRVSGAWDRAWLKHLVTSLVSNAIRHAGGRIELGVLERGSDAELVIRDHGPGLAPSVLARWSEPFDPVRSRADGSFGIGLWLVANLAGAMRGSVTAINCPDGGARFCVVVPRG